ncbi:MULTISPECIES: amidase [Streptomyces]|uniref:amidase n=1 Tax=Streptomyces TaxID=1883 RepID=UPI001E3E85DB|nr:MULTISPECIES: amidase [Streptomyces]UFQ13775.1 amidase [Streptomyces huasconensis]WCL83370.1 amidase [Streptomyces sp. JCM 35825]
MRPYELTLAQAARAIAARELSPVELAASVLDRIDAVEGDLGAYVTVLADAARQAAARAEEDIAAGRRRGPLHGVPMGLKDLIDVAGLPTTASSRVRAAAPAADRDSTVASRLRAAGAVLLGKTHTHEFAYGLTTPQTRNAWSHDRVAGGSSGGSAVAVAAGEATFALGTDTGGSIRVPAALNGVVGLKPTHGLVPARGVTPLSWSLDHVGPITRTVEDAGLVLAALLGGAADTGAAPGPAPRPSDKSLTGLRVGVPRNHYFDRVHPEVEQAVRAAIGTLGELGAELVGVDIPMTKYLQATQWGLMVPEATAYHERTLRTSPELYADDVRTLLEAGGLVPVGDYLRARRSRTLMRAAWARLFRTVDVIAAPTVPATAARRDQQTMRWPDGSEESVSDAYVRLSAPANITGMPALTLPVGADTTGLSIGMQLIGEPFGEATVVRVGRAYEMTRSLKPGERGKGMPPHATGTPPHAAGTRPAPTAQAMSLR